MAGPPKINKHYESDDVIPEPQQEQGWKGRRPGDGLSSTGGGRAAWGTGQGFGCMQGHLLLLHTLSVWLWE